LNVGEALAAVVPDFADPHSAAIAIRALGLTEYEPCWRAMQAFTDTRNPDTRDELWLTEHPPVYTLGLAGRPQHLLRETAIPLVKVDRGGQITFHGPGQLVVYVLMDLRRRRLGIRDAVRRIEASVVEWLAGFGIAAHGKPSAPGVYVERDERDECEAKIAALGLRVRNGCTYHGLAVNIAMDLAPFRDIDPCGFPGLAVVQLADFGVARTVEEAGRELGPILAAQLSRA
jgi:lipoyl(octanoyl) transferase